MQCGRHDRSAMRVFMVRKMGSHGVWGRHGPIRTGRQRRRTPVGVSRFRRRRLLPPPRSTARGSYSAPGVTQRKPAMLLGMHRVTCGRVLKDVREKGGGTASVLLLGSAFVTKRQPAGDESAVKEADGKPSTGELSPAEGGTERKEQGKVGRRPSPAADQQSDSSPWSVARA